MKIIVCALLLFSIKIAVFGQKNQLTSRYKALNTENNDSTKVNTLHVLFDSLMQASDFKTADSLAEIEIQLANKLKFNRGIANAYSDLGEVNYFSDDFAKAMDYYLKEQRISDSIAYIAGTADSYNGIGEIYQGQGDYQDALSKEFQSLHLYQKINDPGGITSALNDIGDIYQNEGNDSLALVYDLASLKIYEEHPLSPHIAFPLITIGDIYNGHGEYSKAISYFNRALKYQEQTNDKDGESTTLEEIASVYLKQKQYKDALSYANKSLVLANEVQSKEDLKEIYKTLSAIYDQMGNTVLAFKYFKNYTNLQDSLYGPANTKKIATVEKNFEFKMKQAIEKAERDKKEALVKAEEKRKNILILSTFVVLFLVILFAIILFNRFKITEKQKALISEKNKEITDSINYAKRIQQAMLPELSAINKELPESFVLFKPKDIVSGDFYFFTKANNKLFLAAADCTGHGVPGGFMSMLCSQKLDDAILQNQKVDRILEVVNRGVKSSLHQSVSADSTRDGMDIALCIIEGKNIGYAGANRPLWIIRKNSKEIEEIKATKQSIAGYTPDEQNFEEHQIKLLEGDTFYIFSDGYADQFGGEKEKKLTTKRFKNKLLAIQDLSMKEQQIELGNYIELWKAGNEQVDDILVIGVRI